MKKLIAVVCIAVLALGFAAQTTEAQVARQPGGVPAFFVGCCFGIRTGTMWNDGSELHWREWSALIPYWNVVLAIWNGVDSMSGIGSREWAQQNGANWY